MNKKSGHWTNTGMAKFINDNLYNYKSDDEKSMNPFRWYRLQNGDDVSKYRETINGFPCRLILINDGSTPLNEGQNEPTPGNTKDMGIFNFNHDKDATKTLGFDSDIFPSCASYEVTANSDTSAGAFMSFKHRYSLNGTSSNLTGQYSATRNLRISDFTPLPWTIKSPNRTIVVMRVNNDTTSAIRVGKGETVTITEFPWGTDKEVAFRIGDVGSELLTFELNGCIYTLDRFDDGENVIALTNQSEELAYLKESFELRHPDADDVAEDWGFMGVEEKVLKIDEYLYYGSIKTSNMEASYFNSDSITIIFDNNASFSFVPTGTNVSPQYGVRSGTTISLEGVDRFNLAAKDWTYVDINGNRYYKGITRDEGVHTRDENPYESTIFNTSYGLKALIDWVDNCTDEEFVRDFEEHFHKDYTLRYYCLVLLCGMVDNMGKNMMLDTADNKIFFPRFYDIDTCCSYDNSGQLKFDVDIEMEQGYWNTSSSRLWTRIRDLMHDDIVTTYNNMRQNGVSYENMMKYIYDEQIAKIPQTYYNKDYDVKYAPFADSYIGMAHGDTYEHVKRWLKQRFTFVDTLFDYAPSYNNDVLTIRANTTELMTLEIETYTPVYQHVSWYNGQMDKKKIDGKVSVEFSGTAQAATDQEVLIYGGSNVKSIKGITSMNPNRMLIGSATKLVEIDAHDCPLLADINANKANLSPHEYLNKVDLSNCPLLEGNLRLNNSPLVQEINIKGTNITGMNLPSSIRNLQTLRLPNTMTDLTLNDASMLHTLEFDEGVNLQSVSMTNCNALENVIGLDLLQTPSITLNNSYNTVAELYFKDTTNLSLSNMTNLERVIYTPNNEYETFELINVANAPDYKVTTFNCPKLSTFMTTAPYRESYNDCGMKDKEVITNVELLDGNYTIGGHWDDKGVYTNSGARNEIVFIENTDIIYHLTVSEPSMNNYIFRVNYFNGDTFISRQYYTLNMNTTWDVDLSVPVNCNKIILAHGNTINTAKTSLTCNKTELFPIKDYGDIQSNTTFTANSIDISNTQFTDVKLLCTTDTNTLKLPTTVKNFYCDSSFDLDTDYLEDGEYDVVHGELVEPYTTDYKSEVLLNGEIPNLIPSSADGSLIFSMYAPSNTVAPASGTWDLHGLEFDNFHTFGMNNDVKPSEDSYVKVYNGKNLKIFQGSALRNNPSGSVYIDKNQEYRRVLSPIYLPKGSHTYAYSNGNNSTINYVTELNGSKTQSLEYGHINIKSEEGGYAHLTYITNDPNYPKPMEWIKIDDVYYMLKNVELIAFDDTSNGFEYSVYDYIDGEVDSRETSMMLMDIKSLSMPARYDDYNITIKNADISPKTHNTMLYPLLVNEDNPITGTLDYTNYTGKHLSWSFAYTDEEYVNIIQPKDELLNSYEYRYNAFYDTEYEFDNPYEIARYTSSASGVLPSFNTEFTYTYDEIDNGNGTYTTKVYTDSLDNLPTLINFTINKNLITVDKLNTSKVTTMLQMFRSCENLTRINCSLDTSSVTNEISQLFLGCSNLEYVDATNLVGSNIKYVSSLFASCISLEQIDGLDTWDTSNVTDMTSMFQSCKNLTSLDVSGFDTNKVTNMNNMFQNCSSLTSLDLSNFDTIEVTRMDGMFNGCSALTSLNVSSFDTSKVSIMVNMFYNCSSLTSLDLSNFDTTNVINMNSMFNGCTNLTSLNVSKFNTSKVTDMGGMFRSCNKLTSLDVSGFDTKNVTDMINMFNNCNSLTSLNLSKFDTSKVTNMSSMFYSCNNLTSLDLSGFDTSNVTIMASMFYDCQSLTALDVSGLDTKNVTNMNDMFKNCSKLTSLDLSGFDTSEVTDMTYMFDGCTNLTSLNVSNWSSDNVNTIIPQLSVSPSSSTLYGSVVIDERTLPRGWVYVFDDINVFLQFTASVNSTSLVTFNTSFTEYDVSVISLENNLYQYTYQYTGSNKPTYMTFYSSSETSYSYAIKSIEKLVLTNASHMANMFRECSGLTSIDLSRISISSSVNSVAGMFRACTNLTKIIGLISLDTKNVTNMSNMFNGCSKLPSLDLRGFDTSNVISMSSMFANCGQLTSLDVSGIDISKVTNMSYMFDSCINLTSLDLSGIKISKVTNMESMFYRCSRLTSLDVSGFDTSKVTTMNSMFSYCSGLIELDSMQNISTNLDLSATILDATSLLDVINNLATVTSTKTLTLGSTLLAKLTEEQIAIATNKGWTVV